MEAVDMAKLIQCARIPLEPNVKPGGEVLILADPATDQAVVKAMAAAAREVGAEPTILTMEVRPASNLEPPRAVAGAMKSVDLVVNLTSHGVVHTDAARGAIAAGAKYIGMTRANVGSMTQGAATVDPDELLEVTQRVADLLTGASVARVTSAQGTDVTVDLRGRKANVLVFTPFPGQAIVPFPSGEAPIASVEGGTDGTIVFDTSMTPFGPLGQPLVLRVAGGRITGIEGGPEAQKLRELLASKGDENSYIIGEFSLGTNSKARVTGLFEDRLVQGSVHFGIGDNESLGGKNHAALHQDGIMLRPTVTLDGKVVVENGVLKV